MVLDDTRKVPEHILPEKSLHLYVSDQLIKLSWVLGGELGGGIGYDYSLS